MKHLHLDLWIESFGYYINNFWSANLIGKVNHVKQFEWRESDKTGLDKKKILNRTFFVVVSFKPTELYEFTDDFL